MRCGGVFSQLWRSDTDDNRDAAICWFVLLQDEIKLLVSIHSSKSRWYGISSLENVSLLFASDDMSLTVDGSICL